MMYGVPECIRSDNGPEFGAIAIRRWLAKMNVQTLCSEPDSPWLNRYAESFHSRLRDELLNVEAFENVGMPANRHGLGVRITTSAVHTVP